MLRTDANSIVFQLKDVVQRMHLNLKCCGHCYNYNSCSAMSGFKSGVAVQIKGEEIRVLYTLWTFPKPSCRRHNECLSSILKKKLLRLPMSCQNLCEDFAKT